MAQIGGVTFSPGDRENLFEMQCLRRANDVPNRVGFQLVDTIIDRGDIGRSVIESAVPFANDQRLISQLGIIVEEHDHGAFANFGYPGLEQAIYDAGQPIVVKTFAALKVVVNVEQPVNALEILHRKRDAFVPNICVFLVAGLQFYQFLAAGFTHFRVLARSFVCFLVNPDNLGQRIALQRLSIQEIFPTPNDHPELCSPVADVIIANHFVPKKFSDARQRIAEHRAADVTDMHRFRHIGRSEIDDDATW